MHNLFLVLLSEILKRLYPKLVDLHNYPPRNSFHLKLDNWNTLNRKVFRKLELTQSPEILANLCNAVPGAIEMLCYEIMTKYQADQKNNAANNFDDDTSSDNSNLYSYTFHLIRVFIVCSPKKLILCASMSRRKMERVALKV